MMSFFLSFIKGEPWSFLVFVPPITIGFIFPAPAIPGKAKLINGPLFSVNPLALKKHIAILSENKRILTPLETGTLLVKRFTLKWEQHVSAPLNKPLLQNQTP